MFKQSLDQMLWRKVEEVSRRYRRLRRRLAVAAVCLLSAALGAVLLWRQGGSPAAAAALASAAAVVAIGVWFFSQKAPRDHRWVARRIESRHPELNSVLVAAVELTPQYGLGGYGFLQESVLRDAIVRGHGQKWGDVAPVWKGRLAALAQFTALGALAAVALLLAWDKPTAGRSSAASRRAQLSAASVGQLQVDPGDVELERGSSLLVMARFPGRAPAEAELLVTYSPPTDAASTDVGEYEPSTDPTSDAGPTRLPMSPGLDDPLFGARLAEVNRDLQYQVVFKGGESRRFQVKVFDYPALERADARLVYPSYTSLPEALVQDVRRVSAVEGTDLTLTCLLNKPVALAWLQDEDGAKIELVRDSQDPRSYSARWKIEKTARMKLHLVDSEGRTNKTREEIHVQATENRPPDLKFVFPARDIEASPLEEIDIEATALDDFGLAKVGVAFNLAQETPQESLLLENAAARTSHNVKHKIDLESLQAKPDQLLTYYLWAEDIGADGQPRRVFSDMFFAEVRSFEEIYRQGEQPTEGQMQQQGQEGAMGGQGQATSQLVELQKQIIAAEWNLIRRESAGLSPAYDADTQLLLESQQSALGQAEGAAPQLASPELAQELTPVLENMQQAIEHLQEARKAPSVETHRKALTAEQAAYQGLLKLRAKEFQVIRNSQRQSGQSGGGAHGDSRSERQLNQLELSNDQNRYETQRTARSQETEEQREIRQTQSRLRDLARRQEDVNRQLKELQTALEQAQTPQEREEVERRLKRLRDQQQQLLRDVDELQNRMEQSQNQQQMAPAERRLEETREDVRRASEALEQGQVSQALASGARAEEELRQLRDEFRRATANQFSEEMRQMREDVRQLDQNQQDLSRRMSEIDRARSTNLRDQDSREEIEQQLKQQELRLEQLYEQMRETVQQSEIPEPLLSRELYDSLRTAQQRQLSERLNRSRQLLDAGLPEEARQEETPVREGLSDLRQGVERAAESVLGDEREALRQARDELSELARQLEQEVNQRSGQQGESSEAESSEAESPTSESQAADRRQGGPRGENDPAAAGTPADAQQQQQPGGQRPGEATDQPGQEESSQADRPPSAGEPRPGQGSQDASPPSGAPPEQPSQQASGHPQQSDQEANQRESSPQGTASSQQGTPAPEAASQQGSGSPSAGDPSSDQRRPETPPEGVRDRLDRGPGQEPAGERIGALSRLFGPDGGGNFDDAVLTGDEFLDWSDRLRDVEEMLEDPELRTEAARIRERARDIRAEFRRHSAEPNWPLVRRTIAEPLTALRDRVAEELRRKQQQDSLAPIDRDPIPAQFSDRVRRYYERLGAGEN